jgi:hypothetical protein
VTAFPTFLRAAKQPEPVGCIKKRMFARNWTQLRHLVWTVSISGHLLADRCSASTASRYFDRECKQFKSREPPMVGVRNDRARARARDLLATVYPVPDDAESRRLRQLAIDYIQEAGRLETADSGRVIESDELVAAALDGIARDFFTRALLRAVSVKVR